MSETVLTRDLSTGKIHRRTLLETGELQSSEADNLDQAGDWEAVTAEELANAEPDALCERCFPDVA